MFQKGEFDTTVVFVTLIIYITLKLIFSRFSLKPGLITDSLPGRHIVLS